MLASRSIWLNKVTQIEGVKFTLGCYSQTGKYIGLALKNVLSIYEEGELATVYGFDFDIEEMVSVSDYFFVKLSSGQVVGSSHVQQVEFLEHEEIIIDFWSHPFNSVLLADECSLY